MSDKKGEVVNDPKAKKNLYLQRLLIVLTFVISISALLVVNAYVKNREFPVVEDENEVRVYVYDQSNLNDVVSNGQVEIYNNVVNTTP